MVLFYTLSRRIQNRFILGNELPNHFYSDLSYCAHYKVEDSNYKVRYSWDER